MKFNYILLLLLFTFLNCKKETQEPYTPTNYLAGFQTEKPQFFDLGTLEHKQIIGKHGTKINFNRHLFDVKEGAKIQLKLIELYDFTEILYRNIQTLTTDNELLETSGVLKITFTSDGKKIKLKDKEKITIYPAKRLTSNDNIYQATIDKNKNVKWNKTVQDSMGIIVNIGGGISKYIKIHKDSLNYYEENFNNDLLSFVYDSFLIENFKLINIDKLVEIESKISFKVKSKTSFNYYIYYKNNKSFISGRKLISETNFDNIPIIDDVDLIIITRDEEDHIYYDKINLNKLQTGSKIKLNPKKIRKEKLKELFD